jgi:hypothetical protein
MQNIEFNLDEVFNEIRTRMQTQGSFTKEAYLDTIDEILEEKREEGLLDDDFDMKSAHEELESRWGEIEKSEEPQMGAV